MKLIFVTLSIFFFASCKVLFPSPATIINKDVFYVNDSMAEINHPSRFGGRIDTAFSDLIIDIVSAVTYDDPMMRDSLITAVGNFYNFALMGHFQRILINVRKTNYGPVIKTLIYIPGKFRFKLILDDNKRERPDWVEPFLGVYNYHWLKPQWPSNVKSAACSLESFAIPGNNSANGVRSEYDT